MDEKEKDIEQELGDSAAVDESAPDVQSDSAAPDETAASPDAEIDAADEADDDTLEEKDGVKYETNDDWDFDAEAPTLDNDIVLESADFKITIPENDDYVSAKAIIKKDEPVKTAHPKEALKFVPIALFVAAVIAVLAVLGVRYYTVPNCKEGKLMNPASVAATVDGTKISIGMFDYYYASMVSYYEQYASYGYFDLDTTKDYSKQYTTDDDGNKVSWQKFFEDSALDEIEQITTYYNAAVKDGVTLTSAQKDTIDEQMKSLQSSASENSVTVDEYIQANFGKYCSEDTVRLMLEQYYISANYKGKYKAVTQVTDSQVDKYYNEHQNDYKQITFAYLAFEYDATDDNSKETSVANAEKVMAKITDKASVKDLVPEVYSSYIDSDVTSAMQNDDSLSKKEARAQVIESYESQIEATVSGSDSPFDDEMNKWLFSDDTKKGSKKYYVDTDGGYIYVVLKTENAVVQDDETYTVRHILITPKSDDDSSSSDSSSSDTTYTDEQWAAAKKEADTVLEKFNDTDKSEYSFAKLAEQYSADTASTTSGSSDSFGGLYSSVSAGEMVEEFEKWALNDSRVYGDTGIIKSDYGYHIMYFVNKCPMYESEIISTIKDNQLDDMVTNADIKVHNSVIKAAVKKEKEAAAEAESTTSASASSSSSSSAQTTTQSTTTQTNTTAQADTTSAE